jgi:hypothetical protein
MVPHTYLGWISLRQSDPDEGLRSLVTREFEGKLALVADEIQRCSDCSYAYVRHVKCIELLSPHQVTVNQAAGEALNAAAAAAVQPVKRL